MNPPTPDKIEFPDIPVPNKTPGGFAPKKPVDNSTGNDCNSTTQSKLKKLINDLTKIKNIEQAFNLMRNYIQTNTKDEIGIVVDKMGTNYSVKYYQGKDAGVDLPITSNTYIKVHVHPYYGYSSPSTSDVYKFLIQTRSYPNYQASIILGHDGTEYALFVEDRTKANKINWNLWTSTPYGEFADEKMVKLEYDYVTSLKEQGYSNYQAYAYSMAQLIKEFAPGIKLYMRNNKNEDFKQMNPSKDSNNIVTPKNCN